MIEEAENFINIIKELEDIEYIFINEQEDKLFFTILIEIKNIHIEDKIIHEIVKLIRNTVILIDFIIIPIYDRDIEEFIPVESKLIYYKNINEKKNIKELMDIYNVEIKDIKVI